MCFSKRSIPHLNPNIYLIWIVLCQACRAFPGPCTAAPAEASSSRRLALLSITQLRSVLVTNLWALFSCSSTRRSQWRRRLLPSFLSFFTHQNMDQVYIWFLLCWCLMLFLLKKICIFQTWQNIRRNNISSECIVVFILLPLSQLLSVSWMQPPQIKGRSWHNVPVFHRQESVFIF